MFNLSEFAAKAIKPLRKSSAVIEGDVAKAVKISIPETKDKVDLSLSTRNADKNRIGVIPYAMSVVPYINLVAAPISLVKMAAKGIKSRRNGSALLEKVAQGSNKPYAAEIGSKATERMAKSDVTALNTSAKRHLDGQYRDLLSPGTFGKKPNEQVYEAGFNPEGRKVLAIKTTRMEAGRLIENAMSQDKGAISTEMRRIQREDLKIQKAIGEKELTPAQIVQQRELEREYKALQGKKSQIPNDSTQQTAKAVARDMKRIQKEERELVKSIAKKQKGSSTSIQALQQEALQAEFNKLQTEKSAIEDAASGAVRQGSPMLQRLRDISSWFTSREKQARLGTDNDSVYEPLLSEKSDLPLKRKLTARSEY